MKGAIVVLSVAIAAGFAPVRADEAGVPGPRNSLGGAQVGYNLAGNGAFEDNAPLLQPGVRVRVSTAPASSPNWIVGTLIAVTNDRLAIRAQPDSGREIEIARTAVTRLEVSHGQRSRWLKGLGLGFLVGTGAGAVLGEVAIGEGDLAPGHRALIGAALGAPLGALTGVVIGALSKSERWQEIPVTVGGMGGAQSFGYAVRVTVPLGFRSR